MLLLYGLGIVTLLVWNYFELREYRKAKEYTARAIELERELTKVLQESVQALLKAKAVND